MARVYGRLVSSKHKKVYLGTFTIAEATRIFHDGIYRTWSGDYKEISIKII